MKKVLALLLCIVMVLGCFTACASTDKTTDTNDKDTSDATAKDPATDGNAETPDDQEPAEASKDLVINVGSKDFTESIIAATIYMQLLEANGYTCVDKTNVSGSDVCQQAILTGDFTVFPEYTGTIWYMIGGHDSLPEGGGEVLYDLLTEELAEAGEYYMGERCSVNNTFCFVVDPDVAGEMGITSLSELGAYMQEHPGELKLACTNEFAIRTDGLLGMADAYGIDFGSEVYTMEKGVALKAVNDGEVFVCMADATDSAIVKYGLTALADDGNYFAAYNMVPLYSAEFAAANPEVVELLDQLAPLFTDEQMRELNYTIDVEGEEPEDVAAAFLAENGLVG